MDQALEAMRGDPQIGAVLAETADFLPLERGVVTQQASVVLETIADGVSITGESGEMIWGNRRLREFGPKVAQELAGVCAGVRRPSRVRARRGPERQAIFDPAGRRQLL